MYIIVSKNSVTTQHLNIKIFLMADDSKQTINPNTNDDLNIDFDIILDQNQEPDKSKEDLNINIETIQKSESDLNFDLNPEAQIKQQEVIKEIEVPIEIEEKIAIPKAEIEENETVQEIEKTDTEILQTSSYNPDLNSVNQTIQQLQEVKQQWKQTIASDKLNEISTTATIDAKITKQETQIPNSIPIWTINLDDILPTSEIKTQSPIQDIPQVPFPQSVQQSTNPYDIATQTTVKTKTVWSKKHLIMVVAIVSACLIAGFFILKTMYPMQFGSSNWWSWNNIDTTQEQNPFQETTPPPPAEIVFTGEVVEETWTDQNIDELTWNILNLSGDIQDHNITDQTDPFQDLDNLQTSDEQKKQATIASLKEFVTQWEYYLNLWKTTNNLEMKDTANRLLIIASKQLNKLENWEILDISEVDSYLAQSSWYLQTLQDLENASNTRAQQKENTNFTENQT